MKQDSRITCTTCMYLYIHMYNELVTNKGYKYTVQSIVCNLHFIVGECTARRRGDAHLGLRRVFIIYILTITTKTQYRNCLSSLKK